MTAAQPRILIAEDDNSMRELMARILSTTNYALSFAEDGLTAIAKLNAEFDLVLTDIRMPRANGLEVLRFTKRRWPNTPVIVLTAYGSISGAVDAMRLGAADYLSKPLPDPQTLRDLVARILQSKPEAIGQAVIGEHPSMVRLIGMAKQVAQTDTTVLLLGESGTGKEVIAQLVHDSSERAGAPFIAVNCAALSEGLLESELFGHERGAFTGAVSQHQGKFEQAEGGTLFLDEIGETSPSLQAKLLRVLQERTLQRVGGTETIKANVRIVTATNKDLQVAVAENRFREDLYYRLAVFPIELPALRERRSDVIVLAQHFLQLLTRNSSKTPPRLGDAAKALLTNYPWPGNVRELQNSLERALILAGGDEIGPDDLHLSAAPATTESSNTGTLREMEKNAIRAALEAEDGNRRRAATRLGIALRTLQYKIKDYDLS